MMENNIRFHWSLSQAGNAFRRAKEYTKLSGLIKFEDQLNLCLLAEENGIDSMLMAIGFTRPDPLLLTVALGKRTKKINFTIAVRSGLITPAYFVQQINTAASLIGDRIYLNVVSGHTPSELKFYGDFLEYDKRFDRTQEFLEISNAYWNASEPVNYNGEHYQVENGIIETPYDSASGRPQIYIGGNSEETAELVCSQGDFLWRFPDAPEALVPKIAPVLKAGKGVGLLASIIVRPTDEEAKAAAKDLLMRFADNDKSAHKDYNKRYDSQGFREILKGVDENDSSWITPCLWNGAVPFLGPPSIAFVGSYQKIAEELMRYKSIGVDQFLFMGWPDEEEIVHFGQGVLPILRKMEKEASLKPTLTL